MNDVFAALVLAPALAVGSFLNVVAARVPARRSIVSPRSACLDCGAAIRARDNVPVLSYLFLRGRCRACAAPISLRYPALELGTALLTAACVAVFGPTLHALAAALFCAALLTVSATDLEHRVVPNAIVLPAAVCVLALQLARDPDVEWPLAALGAGLFLFLAALAYPRGMGMGDVKLAVLLGAGLGRTVPVALLAGMILALVPAAVLVARHGAAARKLAIPFAPFLALGGLVGLFAGHAVLDWYLSFLG